MPQGPEPIFTQNTSNDMVYNDSVKQVVDIGLQLTWDVAEEYYYAHCIQQYSQLLWTECVNVNHTLAQYCESVVKGDDASQWGNQNFDPLPRPNPLTNLTKICVRD